MKLMYGVRQYLSSTLEYGRSRWGDDLDTRYASLAIGPYFHRELAASGFDIHVFDGVIAAYDDEYEEKYIAVRAADGSEREFGIEGSPREYWIGRRTIVRCYIDGRTPRGHELISVFEIWLE